MEDHKKHLLHFIFILVSVLPISIGLFLIANGISNLHISEITTQLNEVAEQIKSLEATISGLNFQEFEKIVGTILCFYFLRVLIIYPLYLNLLIYLIYLIHQIYHK